MADEMVKNLGVGIIVFIGIIVGIVFIDIISDQTAAQTNAQPQTNETFTGLVENAVALGQSNCQAIGEVRNGTADVLTVTTDYLVVLNPCSINLTDTGNNNTAYFADYTFFTSTYIASGTARTLINLIPLFVVIAILLVAVGYGVNWFRENKMGF